MLTILTAYYGAGPDVTDVTALVRSAVKGGTTLTLPVNNLQLGQDQNFQHGRRKQLSVTYQKDQGKVSTKRVGERRTLIL